MDYLTNSVRTTRYTSMGKVFMDFSLISYVKNKFQIKFISKEHKIIIAIKRTLNIILKNWHCEVFSKYNTINVSHKKFNIEIQ